MRAWETARSSHESREKGLKHEFSRGKDMGFVINAFAVTLINSASSSPEIEFSYINLFESKKQSFFTNYGFFSHNKRYIYVLLEMSRNERIIIQDIDIEIRNRKEVCIFISIDFNRSIFVHHRLTDSKAFPSSSCSSKEKRQ